MAHLSRKHYIAIAGILASTRQSLANDPAAIDTCAIIADDLADYFQADNALFNRARFLKACDQKL